MALAATNALRVEFISYRSLNLDFMPLLDEYPSAKFLRWRNPINNTPPISG